MSDLRKRFGAYFGDINAAMTAFRFNEEWREAVLVKIENLVHAARAEEIEACAKVVEDYYDEVFQNDDGSSYNEGRQDALDIVEQRIRALVDGRINNVK